MVTSKPISTISYNSVEFLEYKLSSLFDSHIISNYFFICHKGEVGDEVPEKDHIHLWISPNKRLDTLDLELEFKEPDLDHPDKPPLGVIDFAKSSTDDAILYFQHYKPYLEWKHQSRMYHYKKTDFHFLDDLRFEPLYYHAFNASEFSERFILIEQLKENSDDLSKLIDNGSVPLGMASSLNSYRFMKMDAQIRDDLNRNGRKGHK